MKTENPDKNDSVVNPKPLEFWTDALHAEIKTWPIEVRQNVGFQFEKVKRGKMPDDYKSMKQTIGTGVYEIRDSDRDGAQYRAIFIATFSEAVYVIHLITKK